MIDIDVIRSMQRPELHHQISIVPIKRKALTPGPFDVICARGKQAYNHAGVSTTTRLLQAVAKTSDIFSR